MLKNAKKQVLLKPPKETILVNTMSLGQVILSLDFQLPEMWHNTFVLL